MTKIDDLMKLADALLYSPNHLRAKKRAALQKAIENALSVQEEQRLTIKALNSCINGPGSTTTENLTIVDRLEKRIQELETKFGEPIAVVERADNQDGFVLKELDGRMKFLRIGDLIYSNPPTKCMCGAKPSCDYEWGPDCDLGNNEAHCRPVSPQPKL